MLHLQKEKGINYVTGWISKRVYSSTLFLLHTAFLHSANHFEYKKGVEFDKEFLVVEQNNYAFKVVNACIIYELDTWPKVSLKNFKSKNRMFGATNIVK